MQHSLNTLNKIKDLLIQQSQELFCLHKADGTYLFVSDAITRLTGYKPDELIGKNPYEFFHPKDQAYIRQHSHMPSLTGEDKNISEYRFLTKGGKYIWLQTTTTPIDFQGEQHLLTTSRNISDLVSLRSTANQYKNLMHQASFMSRVGVWEFNLDDEQPFWSPVVYDIHEVPYDEQPTLEKALNFFDEGESRDKISEAFGKAVTSGEPFDLTVRFTGAKGTKKWVRSICTPEVEAGQVSKVYGVFQDVTSQKNQTEQLKLLSEVLKKQKDQLESFNQIVSHNLRSPVSNLPILLDLMEESKTKEERDEMLTSIRNISTNMREMLDDLVDVAKLTHTESLKTKELSLKKVYERVLGQLSGNIKKHEAIITLDNEAWKKIIYPEAYLESILLNLTSNALKYRSEKRTPKIHIEAQNRNDMKYLVVSDNGTGIDMTRNRNKIFKLHKTFHRDRPGKGLGLFMTKNQIMALGGDITVESTLDEGTTFTINFNIPIR